MLTWKQAVDLSSWMSANLAHTLPQSRWPLGGWESLGDLPENRVELRRRCEMLLSVPSVQEGLHGADLRTFSASLGAPASAPAVEVVEHVEHVEEGDGIEKHEVPQGS